jgi:hypothetical protein
VIASLEQSHLSFFRDDGDLESDFVLDYSEGRLVVEVTASSDPPPRKFERLRSVGEVLSASKVVLLQGGLVRADGNEMSVSLPDFLLNPLLILGRKQ